MSKDFHLTDETTVVDGHTLHRIMYEDGVRGGWLENAYNITNGVRVLDNAMVYGSGFVEDNVIVQGNARIYGNARVSGDAFGTIIEGDSRVYGNALVYGRSCVKDSAEVYGNAEICDSLIYGNAKVYENAKLRADTGWESVQVGGDVEIHGDMVLYNACTNKEDATIIETQEDLDKYAVDMAAYLGR